jgi:hypothetical protein
MAKLPLAETHQLAKSGKVTEELLLKTFLENIVLVPSKTDPKKKGILPATSEIDGVDYVLAFDSYESAQKSLGKELRKGFLPSVYGDKFSLIVADGFGIAVGTKAGGLFTISPELLQKHRKETLEDSSE